MLESLPLLARLEAGAGVPFWKRQSTYMSLLVLLLSLTAIAGVLGYPIPGMHWLFKP